MAELLIQPIIDGVKSMLQALECGEDDAFRTVAVAWTGLLVNPPAAWVMPGRTQFPDRDDGTTRKEVHAVTIRLGLSGSDPDELTYRAMRYVGYVDDAVENLLNTVWGNTIRVLHVVVLEHNYGLMWHNSQGTVAVWPDLHIEVEVEELR